MFIHQVSSSSFYPATVKNFLGCACIIPSVSPVCMNSLELSCLLSVRMSGVGMNIRLDPGQAQPAPGASRDQKISGGSSHLSLRQQGSDQQSYAQH